MKSSWKYLVFLCFCLLASFVISEESDANVKEVIENEQITTDSSNELAVDQLSEKETDSTTEESEIEPESKQTTDLDEDEKKPLPPSLTLNNFDRVLSDGLHFVEFFSPYCGHCKALAPVWKDLYQKFSDEANKLNVYLHQVDCVENGDLCAREAIRFYPAIRLYAPNDKGTGGKLISTYPSSFDRTVDGFSDYLREAAGDFNEDGDINIDSLKPTSDKSSSPPEIKFLDSTQLLNIIGGKISKPILVSFWSSSDEDLNSKTFLSDPISSNFYESCSRCFDFRNIWLKVNKLLSSYVHDDQLELGIVNCKSNKKICTSLGMHDLVNYYEEGNFDPKVFMFLPSDEGGNKIRFKAGIIAAKRIVNWSKRLLDIYKFEDISMRDMMKKKRVVARMPNNADSISETPVEPSITFVYYYDKEAHVPEDDVILKHLLQPIMDSIFNVYIYKSSDPAVLEQMKKFDDSLVKYIESGVKGIPSETEAFLEFASTTDSPATDVKQLILKPSQELFASRTLSNAPMLICFKDYSFSSYVLQSFGTEDSRDYNQFIQFIKKHSIPSLFEMTDYNKREIFPSSYTYSDSIHDKSEKVLITFVDSNEIVKSYPYFYYMAYIQQSYDYMKLLHQFDTLKLKREEKDVIVQGLKDKNADTADIIKAMRMKVPNVFNQQGNLINVYCDINSLKYFRNYFKWNNIDYKDFKLGDTLLVSRFKNEYWERPNDKLSDSKNVPILQVSNTKEVRDLIFESAFKIVPPEFPLSIAAGNDKETNKENKKAKDNKKNESSKTKEFVKSKLRSKKLSSSTLIPKFLRNSYTLFILTSLILFGVLFYRKYKHSMKVKADKLKALGILGLSEPSSGGSGKFD